MNVWAGPPSGGMQVLRTDTRVSASAMLPPAGLTFVASVDGTCMVDETGIFDELSREFRFAAYFGWNWPATFDCLTDLRWLPADRYLLVVRSYASAVMQGTDDALRFLQLLKRVSEAWANPVGREGGTGISFKVVVLCDAGEADQVELVISTL